MLVRNLQKWYTRVISIFFTLVVVSLLFDLLQFGHRPETWHKIFHVLVGVSVLFLGWSNEKFWGPFCLVNGAFFTFVGLFGLVFSNFAGLDAFNTIDTILHLLVGISGVILGFFKSMR